MDPWSYVNFGVGVGKSNSNKFFVFLCGLFAVKLYGSNLVFIAKGMRELAKKGDIGRALKKKAAL